MVKIFVFFSDKNKLTFIVLKNKVMEENSIPAKSGRKQTVRSTAYPAITIEYSLKFLSEFYKNFRNEFAKREDILDVIEGSHARHLAASRYYTFLERDGDLYKLTESYKKVVNSIDPLERQLTILYAFKSPKLYSTLIEKFDGDELPDEETLQNHLIRFYGITEDAAPLAAEIFISNAKYCGVLDGLNFLEYKSKLGSVLNPGISTEEIKNENPEEIKSNKLFDALKNEENLLQQAMGPINMPNNQKLIPEILNEEKVKIRLTNGKLAYLIHPLDITKTDIAIIQKQIEQLLLIVEAT